MVFLQIDACKNNKSICPFINITNGLLCDLWPRFYAPFFIDMQGGSRANFCQFQAAFNRRARLIYWWLMILSWICFGTWTAISAPGHLRGSISGMESLNSKCTFLKTSSKCIIPSGLPFSALLIPDSMLLSAKEMVSTTSWPSFFFCLGATAAESLLSACLFDLLTLLASTLGFPLPGIFYDSTDFQRF